MSSVVTKVTKKIISKIAALIFYILNLDHFGAVPPQMHNYSAAFGQAGAKHMK